MPVNKKYDEQTKYVRLVETALGYDQIPVNLPNTKITLIIWDGKSTDYVTILL
jgi:hypothetical protein